MNTQFKLQMEFGTTLLTPNRRLSATLHKLYKQQQIAAGKQQWQTPDVLPLASWIQRLFDDYAIKSFDPVPLLLNTAQEQFLWEKIIAEAKESEQLLQVSETADMAKSAWTLLKQWKVSVHHPLFKSTEDYAALVGWTTAFAECCEKNNFIDTHSLPDFLLEKIKTGAILLPTQLVLVGFTETSPQLKELLAGCQTAGCTIQSMELTQAQSHCKRISLIDSEAEILTMARWAKSKLASDSNAQIACVIPSLDKILDRVTQIFSEVFANENADTIALEARPFNISAGKNLLNYPLINTALQLLDLHKKIISTEALSYLLLSPFLGESEAEHIKRSTYDSLLRQENMSHINLFSAIQKTDEPKKLSLAKHCPALSKRIAHYLELLNTEKKFLSFSEWANLFAELLTAMGWPGERSLSSEEYQVVECWLQLLADFKTLDQVCTQVNIHQALQALYKMAAKMLFQPKTPEAPIQVLGLLEAAGLPFDELWIAGMNDLAWPPQPKPNPFIPKRLQRELQMPHATAERELLFCNILLQQFKHSTKQLIFSHAEKDERLELQVSPLIRDIPLIHFEDLHLEAYQRLSERIFQSKMLVTLVDEKAPNISIDEKIRGGVNIIKQQALCPFKAFSEWRLHARELEEPLPGLRSRDRGKIIHKALELFWNSVTDQETLLKLDEGELKTLIDTSVDNALQLLPTSHSERKNYIELEKKRLFKILNDWLQIEKTRSPFKVLMHEKTAQINFNQLNLSVRIDRIDELSDGQHLIIDYKTGKHFEIGDWFSERPEEPQLPLYALLDADTTIGISFAQIVPGENIFKGVSRYAIKTKGVKSLTEIKKTTALSWEEQLTQWKTTLTKLSDDFSQGIANVDPKDVNQTCTWCALQPLCRINESVNDSNENE